MWEERADEMWMWMSWSSTAGCLVYFALLSFLFEGSGGVV